MLTHPNEARKCGNCQKRANGAKCENINFNNLPHSCCKIDIKTPISDPNLQHLQIIPDSTIRNYFFLAPNPRIRPRFGRGSDSHESNSVMPSRSGCSRSSSGLELGCETGVDQPRFTPRTHLRACKRPLTGVELITPRPDRLRAGKHISSPKSDVGQSYEKWVNVLNFIAHFTSFLQGSSSFLQADSIMSAPRGRDICMLNIYKIYILKIYFMMNNLMN